MLGRLGHFGMLVPLAVAGAWIAPGPSAAACGRSTRSPLTYAASVIMFFVVGALRLSAGAVPDAFRGRGRREGARGSTRVERETTPAIGRGDRRHR